MTRVLMALLAVGALVSGFTCSKNTPNESAAPAVEQSAAPMESPESMEGAEDQEEASPEVESESSP